MTPTIPGGFLFDYGGTLVEEISFDVRAGNEWLLSCASYRPPNLRLEDVLVRASRVTSEVADRRDETHLETPWPAMTKLIHDFLGVRFDLPLSELEIGFWKASVLTKPMPGVRLALERFRDWGIPLGVVSNTCFSAPVIQYELGKHGLAEYLDVVVVSAEYAVRKPNPLLFDTAAARFGKVTGPIWVVGDRLDTDIAGGKAAGMPTAWFNRSNIKDPAQTADYVFADWKELVLHTSRLAGLA